MWGIAQAFIAADPGPSAVVRISDNKTNLRCKVEIPPKVQRAAQSLKQGHRANRITVRDFLRHFGAERRGAVKVAAIRRILDSLDLRTEPDFETAWIDEPIWLTLKGSDSIPEAATTSIEGDSDEVVLEGTPSAVEQAV